MTNNYKNDTCFTTSLPLSKGSSFLELLVMVTEVRKWLHSFKALLILEIKGYFVTSCAGYFNMCICKRIGIIYMLFFICEALGTLAHILYLFTVLIRIYPFMLTSRTNLCIPTWITVLLS